MLFPYYTFSTNWVSCKQKRTKKSLYTMTTRPRLLHSNRCWTAKSNLYFEISQLLPYSSFASLITLPKQLYFFPRASVRKTSFRTKLVSTELIMWAWTKTLKAFDSFWSIAYHPLHVTVFLCRWLGNCLNTYPSIILLLEFIILTKFTFKTSTLP